MIEKVRVCMSRRVNQLCRIVQIEQCAHVLSFTLSALVRVSMSNTLVSASDKLTTMDSDGIIPLKGSECIN